MTGTFRVVIVGGGRVGSRTATLLDDRGHDVVMIEADPDVADEISDAYVATVIQGDATNPEILRQADLERADAVAALTNMAGTNLAICLLVRELAPDVRTIMRTDSEPEAAFDQFVDEVVFPERAGARAAANAIELDVSEIEAVAGNLDILYVMVAEGAPVAGRKLTDIALPRGSLIVSDANGNDIAGSETVLEPGREYIVAAEPDVVDEVLNLMRG